MRLPSVLTRLRRPPSQDLARSIHQISDAMLREADKDRTIAMLSTALLEREAQEISDQRAIDQTRNEYREALYMGGAGPWRMPIRTVEAEDGTLTVHESALPYIAQGAYGDAELMLQNIEWKRETSLSLLEFTRWGIQQIILIARLRSIKDPMLCRGMSVSAQYVFGRGVEITSEDPTANQILKDWRARNKSVLGHVSLTELHRSKYYDGNIFFVCFTDSKDTGQVNLRTFDAVEIMDILSNPEDSSEPWYYRRDWVETQIAADGSRRNVRRQMWYPALNFEPGPGEKFDTIENVEVNWEAPVYHRKCNAPRNWHFGLPGVYTALGYSQAVKRFLEDCMTIRNSLAQFSMLLTTKGGQQALQGAKTQLSTTVGPNASLWDQNPTAVPGAVFASGPGTELKAFSTKGAGGDPAEVREYKLMVCMVFGLPESFFADMNTSNLATATSLDRPTELNFMEQQEVWTEDLTVLALYQLKAALGAASGRLRESVGNRKVRICERSKFRNSRGRLVYEAKAKQDEITVMVNFPSIIEADVPANVGAIVNAATFGNKGGEVVGIDEREAVRLCSQELGIAEEVVAEQYPETGPDAYDPVRTKEPEPALNPATGLPATQPTEAPPVKQSEALRGALKRLSSALKMWEAERTDNGIVGLKEGWVTINGSHVLIGDDGTIQKGPKALIGTKPDAGKTTKPSKSEIAKLNYAGGLKEHQEIGDKTAREVGDALGIPVTSDNKAFDVENKKYGIEVKTLVVQKNDKITMNSYARQLKQQRVDEAGIKPFTVVVDKRPKGFGSSTGETRYLVKAGFGSFRVSGMTEVKSLTAIKTFMSRAS